MNPNSMTMILALKFMYFSLFSAMTPISSLFKLFPKLLGKTITFVTTLILKCNENVVWYSRF